MGHGLAITCLATPGDDRYVGLRRHIVIDAPISAVEAVVEDVAHYRDLFPDVVDARITSGSLADRFTTAWEQRLPIPLMPHVRFELSHRVDKPTPGRSAYRYRLKSGGTVIASDGIAVLEALDDGRTLFIAYDFLKAHWGPLPTTVVWRETVRGTWAADVAIALRAEHPAWTLARVAEEARQRTDSESVAIARCFHSREPVR